MIHILDLPLTTLKMLFGQKYHAIDRADMVTLTLLAANFPEVFDPEIENELFMLTVLMEGIKQSPEFKTFLEKEKPVTIH